MAQLVGCSTCNPRVVGSIPGDANCFMWDNILGQDVNLDCASLHPGAMGTLPEGTEITCVKKLRNPGQGVNVKSSDSIYILILDYKP